MVPLIVIHDAPDGPDPGAHAAPVAVPPVLSGPHVVHSSSVVGLVVEQPVAVHHITGVDVGHVVAIHHVGAVVHHLHHLTSHVRALIHPHPEGTVVLHK